MAEKQNQKISKLKSCREKLRLELKTLRSSRGFGRFKDEAEKDHKEGDESK